ncbi:type IV secretory system conjugative DNA transfer family protein [bacterium]|nr:type IV secretory system conjugative DNA transfer family protein [bacterium]
MKPRKQSSAEYVILALSLLAVVFLSLKAGMALTDKAAIEAAQGMASDGLNSFNVYMDCFNARLADPSLSFEWNENVKKTLSFGGFVWFLVTAYWFTSKKKYITGKEYGTAEWGKQKDISDLFAINLMNKEIRQAKQVKTAIGRFFAKMKVKKTCKKNAVEATAVELRRLESWKSENIPSGKNLTREQRSLKKALLKQYSERKKEIEERGQERYREAFAEAWKPQKLKQQYEADLAEIVYQYEQKLIITTAGQKQSAEKVAKERYEKALKDFYNGKSKVEKIKKKYENADALFTKTERISIYNYVLNNNTLILGGSGSGKTRGFVMPNILQAHSSFVVTDPKGEILEKAGYFLETVQGYKIHVLNLDDKSKSDGYNPFSYIHPEREGYEERVLMLIEAIIINTDGGEKKGGSDPFWDKAERLFLQAIFFFTCDGFLPEEQNMNTVLSLIGMLQIGEEEDNRDSDLDYFAEIFKEKHGEDHIGVQQFREFREKASGKTAKSIVISAVARLAPFRTSAVRRIFSYDTMMLDRLGEEKTAVFVVVPPTDTTFNFIAGMLFTQMFQELQYCATQVHKHEGQRLPVPVRFVLDEFANTCTIPQFVKILAYARSFGIGIVPILQSLEQIKNMYKDEWGIIVDNCNTLLYLGSITHMDTLEYMSKLLGKGTFDKKTTGRTRGKSGSSSQNFDVIGRELMDTAEIRKLPKKDCLLVVGGRNPFYSEKYDYQSHPNYKYTSDANHAYSYEYVPPEPPKLQSQDEFNHGEDEKEERIAAWVDEIMERVDKDVDEIQMDFNVQSLLNHLGQSFAHFAPIRNDLMQTDDGSDLDDDMLLDVLNFREEDERINDLMSNVQKKVEEAKENVERRMEEDGYVLTAEPTEVAKMVIAAGNNLVPIRNEIISTDDGENVVDDKMLDDFELDTDLEAFIEDDFGDLGGLIANITEALEEAITA